ILGRYRSLRRGRAPRLRDSLSDSTSSTKRRRKPRAANPTTAAPSRKRLRAGLLIGIAIVLAVGLVWVMRRAAAQFDIVAEQTDVRAGSNVLVYWRATPAGNRMSDAPFVESFELTASSATDGGGSVRGEQLLTRLEAASLGGKFVRA